MEGTTMEETAAMGGTTAEESDVDAVVVEEQLVVPVATLSVTTLPMENTVAVNDMFKDLSDTKSQSVLSLLRSSPNLTTFVTLVEHAGLLEGLERLEAKTIFAPTNEAFAKLPKEQLEQLVMADNKVMLSTMLQAHILPQDVTAQQLDTNTRIRMSEDSYIQVERAVGGTVTRVGGAQLVLPNVEGSDGRIHVVDSVILPSREVQDTGNR